MARPTKILCLLLLLGCAWGLTSCGDSQQTIEVTAVLPLTGQYAVYGVPIHNALELAHRELQEREDLGYVLELDVVDSGSDAEQAAELLGQAYEDGAFAAIGGVVSDSALAMVPVATRAERVLLSPTASSPRLTGASRYFYRIYPSDLQEGTRMGNFAAQSLDVENVVVLAAENNYSQGITEVFQNEFERYDKEILEKLTYPEGTGDFSQILDQVMELQPQAVYVADYAEPVRRILEGLKERGFRGTLLTTSAFASPEVIEAAGDSADDVVVTQVQFDPASEDPRVQAFVDGYREAYGSTPGLFAAHGYDALFVLAEAISQSEKIASELWKHVRSVTYTGITGSIELDERGDVGKYPRGYILQDGSFEDYDRVMKERREQLLKRLEEIRRRRARALRESQGS